MPMPPPLRLREEGPKGQAWRGPQAHPKGGTITPPCRNPYPCCLGFQKSSWRHQVLVFLFFLVAISGQPIPIQARIPDPQFVFQKLFISLPVTGFTGVSPHLTRSGNFSGIHTQRLLHQGVKVLPRPLRTPCLSPPGPTGLHHCPLPFIFIFFLGFEFGSIGTFIKKHLELIPSLNEGPKRVTLTSNGRSPLVTKPAPTKRKQLRRGQIRNGHLWEVSPARLRWLGLGIRRVSVRNWESRLDPANRVLRQPSPTIEPINRSADGIPASCSTPNRHVHGNTEDREGNARRGWWAQAKTSSDRPGVTSSSFRD